MRSIEYLVTGCLIGTIISIAIATKDSIAFSVYPINEVNVELEMNKKLPHEPDKDLQNYMRTLVKQAETYTMVAKYE